MLRTFDWSSNVELSYLSTQCSSFLYYVSTRALLASQKSNARTSGCIYLGVCLLLLSTLKNISVPSFHLVRIPGSRIHIPSFVTEGRSPRFLNLFISSSAEYLPLHLVHTSILDRVDHQIHPLFSRRRSWISPKSRSRDDNDKPLGPPLRHQSGPPVSRTRPFPLRSESLHCADRHEKNSIHILP